MSAAAIENTLFYPHSFAYAPQADAGAEQLNQITNQLGMMMGPPTELSPQHAALLAQNAGPGDVFTATYSPAAAGAGFFPYPTAGAYPDYAFNPGLLTMSAPSTSEAAPSPVDKKPVLLLSPQAAAPAAPKAAKPKGEWPGTSAASSPLSLPSLSSFALSTDVRGLRTGSARFCRASLLCSLTIGRSHRSAVLAQRVQQAADLSRKCSYIKKLFLSLSLSLSRPVWFGQAVQCPAPCPCPR